MRMDMQWAPLLYTHCSPRRLTRTPSFSSADDPMTRRGALGLRGEMATPMRQGVWCLLPVVLNAVPIHTQCCDHYLRDEASWLMALAISSNKHHTHTHTRTHTPPVTRHAEARAWCCLLPIPPASSSLLLLDPPPTPIPTIPPPPHHRHKHLRLLVGCLLLCASKRLFVRGERRILAPQSHRRTCVLSYTHTHTHTNHSHRRLPERELVLLCLCETTIVSPSYTSRHGIHHIIINNIYIYI
jgi:hypothetical protein